MKVIKIILGIIVLISLVFFSTGLVIKEIEYKTEITINKPIEKVFSVFKSAENQKKWLPEIKAVEVVNKNPQEVGSVYKLIVNKEQNIEVKQKVLEFVPNKKITYRFNSDVMIRTEKYDFLVVENQTKIVQKTNIRSLSYILACTFPWFKSKFEEDTKRGLKEFKRVMNSEV